MNQEVMAIIGVGSNLEDPIYHVKWAVSQMQSISTRTVQSSALYRTHPWGVKDQPMFINSVVLMWTVLKPLALLKKLQNFENEAGRKRKKHWGPRVLDLDVLLYSDHCVNEPDLIIPHPLMHQRRFVLQPLHELLPEISIPGLGLLSNFLECNQDPPLEMISNEE
ncbi:MAG: 2-amino-4-hydroxy-6-hydroxymethyldihydropteridine diphosphokinase [bacterium]